MRPPVSNAVMLAFIAIWAGTLFGVSFLATPAKFLAPSLTLPVALDVGRHTFSVFNKMEWGFSLLAILLMISTTQSRMTRGATGLAILVTIVESAWLLPLLDSRVGLIMEGQTPPPSVHHALYIIFEVTKLGALLVVMGELMWRLRSSGAHGGAESGPTEAPMGGATQLAEEPRTGGTPCG